MQQRKVEGSSVHSSHDCATFPLFCYIGDTVDYATHQYLVAAGNCLPAMLYLHELCQLFM